MSGPSVQLFKGLFLLLKGLACVMLWTFFFSFVLFVFLWHMVRLLLPSMCFSIIISF